MTYKVVLHPSDEGVGVSCPGLPGRWSQGATVDDIVRGDEVREVESPLEWGSTKYAWNMGQVYSRG